MKRILLDIDGVCADFIGACCAKVSAPPYNYAVTPADVTHFQLEKCLPNSIANLMFSFASMEGFCEELPWYPGAKEFVAELHKLGEVVVVTSPLKSSRTWCWERRQWLLGHVNKIVHTQHKEMVYGDVLIEDSLSNAHKWSNAHRAGKVVLVDRPWNQDVFDGFGVRVKSYEEALKACMLYSMLP
jgi:5'(3')-deoxyribonucleotidase